MGGHASKTHPIPARFNGECLRKIRHAHAVRRALCSSVVDNHLQFSWFRFSIALFKYVLLCTDVLRSGTGINELSAYGKYENDHFAFYGPWNYTVQAVLRNESHKQTAPLWSYKFSATSIVWRAFGAFYGLDSLPDCPPNGSACASSVLSSTAAFKLIDDVANATQFYRSERVHKRPDKYPVEVILRTSSRFYDRLHHYVLPALFVLPVWRTHQALYYSPRLLWSTMNATSERDGLQLSTDASRLCHPRSGPRPHFCDDIWINYSRSCPPGAAAQPCRSVGVVWVHLLQRLLSYQRRFPDKVVDLTLLSSHEDEQRNQGSVSFMSRRKYDVASIVRVRDCGRRGDDNACLTIAVDDSRYEGCVFASNAIDWFPIVSSLRWFGQTYLHLRIALLLVGCYVARAQEPAYARASICSKLQTTWHLFVRLPSSSLVYGSSIPIVCYALAQVIDASLTYEIIAQHFAQKMGMFTFDARVFFPLAATQMRNVWCLALVVHSVLHWLVVCRSNWSPSQGIPGLPGMFLASAASVSLFTQFRALSLRDAKILTVQLAQREDRQPFASARFVTDHHGPGNMLLEGVVLDLKVFLCLFVSIAMFLGTAHAWLEWRQAYGCRRHSPFSLLVMRSAVPYSAGSLWPAVALSIRWNDSVFSNVLVARRLGPGAELLPKIKVSDTVVTMDDNDGNDSASQRLVLGDSARTRRTQSKFLLHHMEHVHSRCDEVDVVVVLLNLVAMTDPLTLIRLRWIGGYRIQYFEFMPTGRVIILPQQVMRAKANINLPWPQLSYLGEVDSRALQWADLLHCG